MKYDMNVPLATVETRGAARTPGGEATRAAIIEAAERLFRTMGYRKTAVVDIARELRMSPANVYRFFPSKAAINEAVCARILDALDARAWALAQGAGSAADRLRALFRLMQQQTMELFFQDRRLHDMVAAALEQHWDVIHDHVRAIESALAHILRDGQASGDFAPLDPDVMARRLHATTFGFTFPTIVQQKCAIGEKDDLPAMAEGMAELVLRALRP
jgi:AcrR family transcriptional regulator